MSLTKSTSSRPTFMMYIQSEALRLSSVGRYGGAKNLRCAANRLQSYLIAIGKKDVSFQKLKPALLNNFEEWLRQQGVQRNTSSAYMRSLHASYNQAVRDGVVTVGVPSSPSAPCANPFAGVYCGVDKTAKRAVDKKTIRKLQNIDIPSAIRRLYAKQGKRCHGKYFEDAKRKLELTRDLFLFSFCMRGMAFVDLAFLRKSDVSDGFVSYFRRKTRQRIVVRIEPMMQQIIDRWQTDGPYLFPILTEHQDEVVAYRQYQNQLTLYNRRLKTLGQMLGGIHLTSYVSRHSWASTAYAEHVPLAIISQSMGHNSERTTRIYLQELDNCLIDRTNSKLLNAVFEGKNRKEDT